MAASEDEEGLLRSVALQNAQTILIARQRAEADLVQAKETLERKTQELAQALAALQKQSEWLRVTLSSIGDGVVTTDTAGCVTSLNPVAEQLTGWSVAEAAGRPLDQIFEILNEETRAQVESPVTKVIREGTAVGLANHTILVRRDRSEVDIDDSAAPIRDSNGELVGIVLVFRDISERRREERRYRFISDAVLQLSSSLDYEVTLSAVARLAVPQIADWCAVDMLQDDGAIRRLSVAHVDPDKVGWAHEIERRYPTPPDSPRGVPNVLRTGRTEWMAEIPDELLVAGTVDEEHLRLARELGLRSYMVVPMIARGRTLGALTFVAAESGRIYDERDVQLAETVAERAAVALDNALLYREAQAARDTAEAATALREQLISIVSHDLRNPLAAIRLSADQLRRKALDSAVARAVERISGSAERMHRMIEQLLDFSRAHMGGGLAVVPQPMELCRLCRTVVEELETGHPETRIVLDWTDEISGQWDPDRLSEVLSNLIGNAIQHGDGGTVSVTLRRRGDEAVMAVHNFGDPIPDEARPHLFDPFRRGDKKSMGSGLGLGLYIARQIVRSHGGDITVCSSQDEGTTFTVVLPRLTTEIRR